MRAIRPSSLPSPLPCLSSSSLPTTHLFSFSFRPTKRIHFLSPSSSLRQTKKQQQVRKSDTPDNAPTGGGSFNRLFSPKSDNDGGGGEKNDADSDTALKGTLLGGVLLLGVVGGIGSVGYVYKDQISVFLNQFSTFIEGKVFIFMLMDFSLIVDKIRGVMVIWSL